MKKILNDLIVEIAAKKPKKEPSTSKKRCYKLNFDLNRPPDNSRFNLRPFLIDPKKKMSNKTYIEVFENILVTIYKQAPFFQNIPSFEKRITEALLREKDQLIQAEFADEIGTLSFEDDQLRDAFYKMLKGEGEFPSLLNYLALDRQTKPKINVLFASPELISAVLNHERAAKRIIEYRNEVLAQMRLPDTSLTRSQITTELRKQIEIIFAEENLPPEYKLFFDCLIGKPGRLIFYNDPISGKLRYNKILLPRPKPEGPVNPSEPAEEKDAPQL